MSVISNLNNLSLTAADKALMMAGSGIYGSILGKLANWGRDTNCRFYYDYAKGGSILQVMVKGVVGGMVSDLKDEVVNGFKSKFDKKTEIKTEPTQWNELNDIETKDDENKYGKIEIAENNYVYALDDWGCLCVDAFMLAIDVDQELTYNQSRPQYDQQTTKVNTRTGSVTQSSLSYEVHKSKGKKLVWYDTTALVNISSDKNIVTTRVQGRDYSRKELVSNGDIKFSVSGQITSPLPDVYPANEVQKFLKIMQYKGIVEVNNELLDQFGVKRLVITDFNLNSSEGNKSVQRYSFSAIGLQPEKEIAINTDTVTLYEKPINTSTESNNNDSKWIRLIKDKRENLESIAVDMVDNASALSTGLLQNFLDEKL